MSTRSWITRRWRVLCGVTMILIVASAAILGCTPQKRYETLSLFFDGVPDPETVGHKKGVRRTGSGGRVVYAHPPFTEQKCNVCHQNTEDIFARAQVKPDACMQCHAAIKTQHRYSHGPMVNDFCIKCHAPHQSVVEHLLRQPMPKLCLQCHEQAGLGPSPPEHLDPKSNCVSCHSGHGGDTRNFLLLASGLPISSTQPATRATTRPTPTSPRPEEVKR